MFGIGASTEHGSVAALQTKGSCINCDVRAGLVNNGNHAEGHAHFADFNAARLRTNIGDFADRVSQRGDLTKSGSHLGNGVYRNGQTINKGFRKTILFCLDDVQVICL